MLALRSYDRTKKIRQLDALWAKIVKERAGYKCERCGGRGQLNAAHIISRARKLTRWEVANAITLCVGCHLHFHHQPLSLIEYVNQRARVKGTPDYDTLRMWSQPGRVKIDLQLIEAQLKAQAHEFGIRP